MVNVMKRFISILIPAVLMLSLVACGSSGATEGGSDNVVEKIKKQPVRSELYDENGTILADISYEYDADGRIISNTTSWNYGFGDGSETDAYTYDDNGNLLTLTKSYSYSDYPSVKKYIYEDGKLVKETFSDDESYGTKYVYGADGKISESYSFNGDDETLWQTYSYTDNTMVQTEEWDGWTFVHTTFYNDNGDIEKWEYKCNGEVMITHNYSYDADGNLTKQDVSIESWKMEGYVLHYYE